jgi:transposase
MNADTLKFLRACVDPHENTIVADCKLVNTGLINDMREAGFGFVSKLPSSFSEKIRERVIASALSGEMKASSVKGYRTYDTECETVCGKLRFVVYRSSKGAKKAAEYLERQGKRDAEDLFRPFAKKRFACEADAVSAFADVMRTHRDSAYAVTGEAVRIVETERRTVRGRPPKGSAEPGTKVSWMIGVTMGFDPERAAELAELRGISVIVTNLPHADEDSGNVRHGATADAVLRLYLDQYKSEHTFRLMKSGMGVDSVYVRTPSRANALLFVVAIATLISNVMDALLRRGGKGRYGTTEQACVGMQNIILRYRRSDKKASVFGSEGSEAVVFGHMRAMGTDPAILLERYDE